MTTQEPRDTWQAGPIRDARGRTVVQLDPVMMHLAHRHEAIPPDELGAIAREIGVGMTRTNRLLFWMSVVSVACLCIALVILALRYFAGGISAGRVVRSLAPFVAIWVAPFSLWMGMRGVRFQRITRVMLEHRRCPHCGYDLRGLAPDPEDDATVCPECGCAWRIGDDGRDGMSP